MSRQLTKIGPGTVVDDRYRVRAKIGMGAFGNVYFANDQQADDMEVALKVLKASALAKPSVVKRFEREARIAGQFVHPHIVRCQGSGTVRLGEDPRERPYMAMELVRGLSLGDIIRSRGPLWVPETVHVVSQVLEALETIHRDGYVHRDLKPDNILVAAPLEHWSVPQDRGSLARRLGVPESNHPLWREITSMSVRLADFGLAKKVVAQDEDPEESALTGEGQAAGTAEFMSPEQVLGSRDLDHRSDIYACGVLLYRLLTGWAPHRGGRQADIALKHVMEPLPPLPSPMTTHPLNAVYLRAGDRNRDVRYSDARAMKAALRRSLTAARRMARTRMG